jgi:hypothetical protein
MNLELVWLWIVGRVQIGLNSWVCSE